MPTPIWTKVTDEAKIIAGSAEAEAEKLKLWALTGEEKVQSSNGFVYIVCAVLVLAVIGIAYVLF